jgi:hypothetical protein
MIRFLKSTALLTILISNYGIAMQLTAKSFIDLADKKTYIHVDNVNTKIREWAGNTRDDKEGIIGTELNGYDNNNNLLSIIAILATKAVIIAEPVLEKIVTSGSADNPPYTYDLRASMRVTTNPIELSGNEHWTSADVTTFIEATGIARIVIALNHTDSSKKE